MEERKNNRVVWIILGVVAGLLVIVAISATAGGIAGYLAGRAAGREHGRMPCEHLEYQMGPRSELPDLEDMGPGAPRGGLPDLEPFGDLPLAALVVEVVEGSAAAEAGLEAGDMITAIDDVALEEEGELADLIASYEPGDTIEIRVTDTDGSETILEATLGRHPDRGGETAYLGITFRMVPLVGRGRMPFRSR